jgi:hypothetical protein
MKMEKKQYVVIQDLHTIRKATKDAYRKLARKYKIKLREAPLYFVKDRLEEAFIDYNLGKDVYDDEDFKNIMYRANAMSAYKESTMSTRYCCVYNDDTRPNVKPSIRFAITIREYELIRIIINNKIPYDVFFRYLFVSLMHEIGHVIHLKGIFDPAEDPSKSKVTKVSKAFDKEYKKLNIPDHYCKETVIENAIAYYNLPMEKDANEAANVQVDKLIEMEASVLFDYRRKYDEY